MSQRKVSKKKRKAESVAVTKKEETTMVTPQEKAPVAATSAAVDTTRYTGLVSTPKVEKELPLGPKNYMIMVAGVVLIFLGYFLMSGGAADDPTIFNGEEKYSFVRITLSVILILVGLGMQVPAIMLKK